LASECWNLGHHPCGTGQEALHLGEVIASFMAQFDAAASPGDAGIVMALEEPDSRTGALSGQQIALEAQGLTTKTLAASSNQDARRLTLLLAGFPMAQTYSHKLRPEFKGPSAWLTCDPLDCCEVVQLLRKHWGITVGSPDHPRSHSETANPESRTTTTEVS
jgi:hypothetical protein